MNSEPSLTPVRVASPAAVLAVIPHLLGFAPRDSLVVLGAARHSGRVEVVLRYDLPDPPDTAQTAEIIAHATGVLARQRHTDVVIAGYGPGRLVTPLADAFRDAIAGSGPRLRDVLRVEDGRFWSYVCRNPACCPPGGVAFDPRTHPAGIALTAAGLPVLADRKALAATVAPIVGREAEAMAEATLRAERAARRLVSHAGPQSLDRRGLAVVRSAVQVYRDGGSVAPAIGHAWLALVLTRLRIRDDAWARMDPAHHAAHRRLWTEVTRRAQPGYVAAPASLLAVVAWQDGNGALANIALDRALSDTPG